MTFELTEQQQHLLRMNGDGPVEVVDPDTKRSYMLIAREQFDKVSSLLNDAEPSSPPEESSFQVAPQMLRSQQAFWRDLPQLLERRKWRGQWVCYHGDERIGIARDTPELVKKCLQLGLQRGDFYVGLIEERSNAPWVCEEMDQSLFEFTD